MTSISDKQRDILRHALGFGRSTRPGWRNHFDDSKTPNVGVEPPERSARTTG